MDQDTRDRFHTIERRVQDLEISSQLRIADMEQAQKTLETHDGELYGYKGVGGLKSKVQSLENQREFTEQQRSHWTDYISLIIAAVAVIIAILKH